MKIELKNISFKYETEEVIHDVSLTINDQEIVAIIGHNGSGKSTLAKLITGLLIPNSGKIYIDGEELNDDSADKLRRRMGIIFQNPDNQFVGVTVEDDIAFGLENRCIERSKMQEIVKEKLALVGMEGYERKSPAELSGGQKQRVAIAGALAINTDLLIFDEATSMLDPKGFSEVEEIIKEVTTKENKNFIIITHNLEEARLANRIVVMNKGKIIMDGSPKEVFSRIDELEQVGLKSIVSIDLQRNLKQCSYQNKQAIEEALWEYAFKK